MYSLVSIPSFVVFALLSANSSWASMTVERSVGVARIMQVANLPAADLVIIDNGFEAGLRQGMVISVTRSGENIGELLIVDIRNRAASALILDITAGRGLQVGDNLAVKTVSSRN